MKLPIVTLLTITLSLCLPFSSANPADPPGRTDLYKITINSQADVDAHTQPGITAVVRLNDGYLVLADEAAAEKLAVPESGAKLIASGVTASEIALDLRRDRLNAERHQLVYEEDELRVYRIAPDLLRTSPDQLDLAPVPLDGIPIVFQPTVLPALKPLAPDVDLLSLISEVSQDSLNAWVVRLEDYQQRVTGTDSNFAAADWIKAKFESFGYDSVHFNDFTATIYGTPRTVRNVVATKIGTRYPNKYIVVGGHRDAVPGSPGADDNASGTVGTLEIARCLANVESYMTIIFIAFDGEEQGLHGSYHWANAAAARGDSILYMLNMDMIAHYQNTTSAKLYHGPTQTYTLLWQHLADSLVGITGVLWGSTSGSDHYPFILNGYEATFVHEYVFSTVYHSANDRSMYMSFPYMTKLVKASLATVYAAMLDASAPAFDFVYSPGIPRFAYAGAANSFQLNLVPRNQAVVVPGSARLHYALGSGGYTEEILVETAPDTYEVTLPTVACGDTLRYYFSVEEEDAGTFFDGSAGDPYKPIIVSELAVSFSDDFETNKGWTTEVLGATSGFWQRGVPVNDPNWAYDPETDGDGSGQCYLTENALGNTDVDNGAVRLTSPVFDLTPHGVISYYYFLTLTNMTGFVDMLLVEINDGQSGTWYEIARHVHDTGLRWQQHFVTTDELLVLGVTPTSTMRVRFTANDANPQSIVEAAVDGFDVTTYDCTESSYICGDVDGNEIVTVSDAVFLIQHLFASGPAPDPIESGDVDCSGLVTVSDAVYLINFLFAGGAAPCAACP